MFYYALPKQEKKNFPPLSIDNYFVVLYDQSTSSHLNHIPNCLCINVNVVANFVPHMNMGNINA